jgi:hypothetical protein
MRADGGYALVSAMILSLWRTKDRWRRSTCSGGSPPVMPTNDAPHQARPQGFDLIGQGIGIDKLPPVCPSVPTKVGIRLADGGAAILLTADHKYGLQTDKHGRAACVRAFALQGVKKFP